MPRRSKQDALLELGLVGGRRVVGRIPRGDRAYRDAGHALGGGEADFKLGLVGLGEEHRREIGHEERLSRVRLCSVGPVLIEVEKRDVEFLNLDVLVRHLVLEAKKEVDAVCLLRVEGHAARDEWSRGCRWLKGLLGAGRVVDVLQVDLEHLAEVAIIRHS